MISIAPLNIFVNAAIILPNGIANKCGTRDMIPLLEINSVPGLNDGADVVVFALVNKGCHMLSMK
jgi:hypothetical protein